MLTQVMARLRSRHPLQRQGYSTHVVAPSCAANVLLAQLPAFFAGLRATQTPQGVLDSGAIARGAIALGSTARVFVVRDAGHLPPGLHIAAAWAEMRQLAMSQLETVERRMHWPPGTLAYFVEPEPHLPKAPVESLMRLFAYDAATEDPSDIARLVPHRDRGLLTLVLSDAPGLRMWDRRDACWARESPNLLTLLAGETLQALTNKRYLSCEHGVEACGTTRHAVVFQLRPRIDAQLNSDALTNRRTGTFTPPLRGSMDAFLHERFAHLPSVNITE